jgi:hypothetical protein
VTTTTVSLPYAEATTGKEPLVSTLLCDDPNDLNPKFGKGRELQPECDSIRTNLRRDVADILRLI